MDIEHKRLPTSFKASVIFFIIAFIPILFFHFTTNNPNSGSGGVGVAVFLLMLLSLMYVSIPAAIITLITGFIASDKTKLAWLTILPTLITAFILASVFFKYS